MVDWYVFNLVFLMVFNNIASMFIYYLFNIFDRKWFILKYLWYISAIISLYIWYLLIKEIIDMLVHDVLNL